jgi:hypothetical protein
MILSCVGVIAAVLLHACNAPHDNLLDPDNPDTPFGVLEGTVKTVSVPRAPIAEALVIADGVIVGRTNANGYFTVETIKPIDRWIYFEKTGFRKDSIYVSWNGAKSRSIEIFLNQIPALDSLAIYSMLTSRYSLPALQQITFETGVNDKDNDIDSVIIECGSLNARIALTYNNTSRLYEKTVFPFELNASDIDEVIGLDMNVHVRDVAGIYHTLGAGAIRRIIRNAIQITSPINADTVSNSPTLTWTEYNATFPYKQTIQVYSYEAEINPILVWHKDNIGSEVQSVTVDVTLPSGNYFWVIWCIDNFSNRIRSNPASFFIP